MEINFTKMHGLGNDFVVIDNIRKEVNLDSEIIKFIADRNMGIGCDQVLTLHKSSNSSADVMFRFYNADGSEVGQCGNGIRCLGKYMVDCGIVQNKTINAETISGPIVIHVDVENIIRVNMGLPKFSPEDIPILYNQRMPRYNIDLTNEMIKVFSLSMGNPHAVIFVDNIDTARVLDLGQKIQENSIFPDGVNVGFLQILDKERVKLRVYERGVGETFACGSGACAAVVAGIMDSKLEKEVIVELKHGNLIVDWGGEGSDVWMAGPATTVFEGKINL